MASGASKIVALPTGLVGSIGVVLLHLDRSKQMEKQGVAPTLIFAGAHKADGHPFAALPDGVRAQFQSEIDALYGAFVSQVAKGRPMSESEIRATEARVYSGAEAVSLGLADTIGTLDDLVASLETRRGSGFVKGATMSQNNPVALAAPGVDAGISQAQLDAAVAAARSEGAATGAAAERARISAILDSDEAKGRDKLARHFAFATEMSPEAAKAALVASEPAAARGSRLDRVAPDVAVGADAPAADKASPEAIGASWDSAFAAAGGKR
jgi:ClpP class serine protease